MLGQFAYIAAKSIGQSTPSQPTPVSTRVRVLIMSGQSNCVGFGSREQDIPASKSYLANALQGIKIWNGSSFVDVNAGDNTDYPAVNSMGFKVFGAEVNYGNIIHNFWSDGRVDYIIKWANNGEAIAEWLSGGGNRDLVVSTVNNALAAISANQDDYSCVFYWDQGEADAKVTEAHADQYAGWFNQMITDFRASFNARSLPCVIRKHRSDIARQYIGKIIQEQIEISNTVDNCQLIESNDLGLFDNVHFNAAAQIELGKRLFDKAVYLFD